MSSVLKKADKSLSLFIPPPNEVGGEVYWIHLVRLSVRLSVDDMVSGA